jgi:IS1 family transposase
MTTENKREALLRCGICCVNCVSDTLNCSRCNKAVCKECFNTIRKSWNKETSNKYIDTRNTEIELIKELENIDKPLTYSYSCPYCRYDNTKQYADLSKSDLLSFINKEYLTYKEIEGVNIKLRTKISDLNKEIEKLSEAIEYEEGGDYLKDCIRRKDVEIVRMASNFSFMISMMTDFENIKKERQTALYELNQMRENYKVLETDNIIKQNKLEDINNILISKLPAKKAIDKLRNVSTISQSSHIRLNLNYEIRLSE